MLEDDDLMVTVELRVRVTVLYTVVVDFVGAEELLPEAGLLSVLLGADWLLAEPDAAGADGLLVVTEVRVSGHTVVDIGTTEVTTDVEEAGQSVTEDPQPYTVT